MGFLGLFGAKAVQPSLLRLPSGSFTILPDGRIVASTLPQSFPSGQLREIGRRVLSTFNTARESGEALSELVIEFSALKITAREMRGGAMIFLAPRDPSQR